MMAQYDSQPCEFCITALPIPLLEAIAEFSEARDLGNLACAGKELHSSITGSQAWHKLCTDSWPQAQEAQDWLNGNWYHMYRFCTLKWPGDRSVPVQIQNMLVIDKVIAATQQAYKHTMSCKVSGMHPDVMMQHCKEFIHLTSRLGFAYSLRHELADAQFPCFSRLKEDMLFWAKEHQQVIGKVVDAELVFMNRDCACRNHCQLRHSDHAKYAYILSGLEAFLHGPLALKDVSMTEGITKWASSFMSALSSATCLLTQRRLMVGNVLVVGTKHLDFVTVNSRGWV